MRPAVPSGPQWVDFIFLILQESSSLDSPEAKGRVFAELRGPPAEGRIPAGGRGGCHAECYAAAIGDRGL